MSDMVKVGDTVTINPDTVPYQDFPWWTGASMAEMLGKSGVVTSIWDNREKHPDHIAYYVEIDGMALAWREEDLIPQAIFNMDKFKAL